MNISEMISTVISIVTFVVAGAIFVFAHRCYTKRVGASGWVVSSWDIKSYRGKERKLLGASIILFVLAVLIYIGGNPVK